MTAEAMYNRELNTSIDIATAAGSFLREEFNRHGGPRGTTHHAEADERAEGLRLKRLTEAFPEEGFFGEELGRARACTNGTERYWVVDPNDGTSAFMSGFRGAAVSITLFEKHWPVLGVCLFILERLQKSPVLLTSPLKKLGGYRLVKNHDMQGAQISRNESYIEYVAVTRDEAQRGRSRFSTAC